MARTWINNVSATEFTWSITELGSPFSSTYYTSAGISTTPIPSGGTTNRPSVLVWTDDWTYQKNTNSITEAHYLSPGSYTLYGFANVRGTYYPCGSVPITVPYLDKNPPSIGTISTSISGVTKDESFVISCPIYDVSGIQSASVQFNGENYSYPYVSNGIYSWRVNTPTVYGEYTITVGARDNYGNVSYSSTTVWIGRDIQAPTFTTAAVSYNPNDGRIQARGVAADNMSGVRSIFYRISYAGRKEYRQDWVEERSNGESCFFDRDAGGNSFVENQRYFVQFTTRDWLENYSSPVEVEIVVKWVKPSSWSWTTEERYALDNKGLCTTITRVRWNQLVDKVLEISRWYASWTSGDPYGVEDARLPEGNYALTAKRFLAMKRAIGSMYSTNYDGNFPDSLIETGRTVYGWYFVRLSECLGKVQKPLGYSIGTMEQLYNMEALMISAKIEDINKEAK